MVGGRIWSPRLWHVVLGALSSTPKPTSTTRLTTMARDCPNRMTYPTNIDDS